MPIFESTPVSSTMLNPLALSFSRLQSLFDVFMVIIYIYDIGSAIFSLDLVFSWIQLGSVFLKIVSAVNSLVQIFKRYRSQLCNSSAKQDDNNNMETTWTVIFYIYNTGSAIFDMIQACSLVFSWIQLGSAVFKIVSNVKSVVKIFQIYRSQLYNGSVTQDDYWKTAWMLILFIYRIGVAILDLRKLGSAVRSLIQIFIRCYSQLLCGSRTQDDNPLTTI